MLRWPLRRPRFPHINVGGVYLKPIFELCLLSFGGCVESKYFRILTI